MAWIMKDSIFSNWKQTVSFPFLKNPCAVSSFERLNSFCLCEAGGWRPYGSNPAYSRLHTETTVSQKAIARSGTWRPPVSQSCGLFFVLNISPKLDDLLMPSWTDVSFAFLLQYRPHHIARGCDRSRRVLQGAGSHCLCQVPLFLRPLRLPDFQRSSVHGLEKDCLSPASRG